MFQQQRNNNNSTYNNKSFEDEIVIDGMTEQELANKLNKSLNELENTGHYFASILKNWTRSIFSCYIVPMKLL